MAHLSGFISLLILAAVHLFANRVNRLSWLWHGRFLSFAAGISFAYVFVDLLPMLEKGQPVIKKTFDPLVPYFSKHAYVIALLGVLFYYGLHKQSQSGKVRDFWLSFSGYALFNFFVGVSLFDSSNPEIQPIFLFTIALGMHYMISDHNATESDGELYQKARWMLVCALFLGYFIGFWIAIPLSLEAIVISFLAGGVFLNVLRYELPQRNQIGYMSFVMGALLYTAIVLSLGDSTEAPLCIREVS